LTGAGGTRSGGTQSGGTQSGGTQSGGTPPGGNQSRILGALEAGTTVVTANRRLSRELVANYDQHQLATGATAWHSADVLPLDAWLRKIWELLGVSLKSQPLVLNDGQLYAIWQQLIAKDISEHANHSRPLWNTHASAKAGINALKIIRVHKIDPGKFATSGHPDHQCFVRWFDQFSNRCTRENWIDHYQLADLVAGSSHQLPRQHLLLAGFHRIGPQQQALVDALEVAGHQLQIIDYLQDLPEQSECMTFDHNEEQWRAAGQWAREILAEHPHRRIAIVAPDLGKYREVIEHGLKESLCPLALINPGDAANQPYHLSLGTNLASHPASGSGLKLLEFVFARGATIAQISEQIVSPYIVGAQNELGERSALAMRLPRLLPYESNLTRLLDEMDYQMQQKQMEPCPILYNTLQQSIQLMLELPAKDTAANWALHFTDMLEIFDWPGECNPGSDEFQAINAFRQRLNQLAELDLVLGKIRIDSALGWLRRRLSDQLFQVEAKQAQVQVLGILETTGLDFDHVWFGGLIEPDWPPGSRPNPFIPITLQREAGVETSSVDAARQYADLLQHGLFASAGDIVLSRHLYDGDVLLECSPLVMQCGALNAQTAKTTPSVVELLHDQKPEFESIDENKGPALDLDTPVAGGTGLMQMQSQCPRGAFARFRLGAEPLHERQQGLDAAERGSLVHRALELAWNNIKDSTSLHALSDQDLSDILYQCCIEASIPFKIRSGCGDQFFTSQTRWLKSLATEWFELEKQRVEPFQVLDTEQKAQLNLAGLALRFSIDRVDRLGDGRLALIDYKTGSQNSVADWLEARPAAPQLPLYTITQDGDVSVVAYAQVRAGSCCYIGLSDQQAFAGDNSGTIKITDINDHRNTKGVFHDWQVLEQYWQHNLEALAREFVNGDFSVDPDATGLCSHCPTPSFCRSGDRIAEEIE